MTTATDLFGVGPYAHRHLGVTHKRIATSMERLSTGLRITTAADDAAGLANSQMLSARVSGTRVAIRNVQDAVNLTRTADGVLGEKHALLQHLRELAVRRANSDVLGPAAADAIDAQMRDSLATLEKIASATQLNGTTMLDGTFRSVFQVGAEPEQFITLNLDRDLSVAGLGLAGLGGTVGGGAGGQVGERGGGGQDVLEAAAPARAATTTATLSAPAWEQIISGSGERRFRLDGVDGHRTNVSIDTGSIHTREDFLAAVNTQIAGAGIEASLSADGIVFSARTPGAGTIGVSGWGGPQVQMGFGTVISEAGADDIPALLAEHAQPPVSSENLIAVLDRAIGIITGQRAIVGAVENALSRRAGALATIGENLTAALSRIRDTDMAAEVTALRMNQILLGGAASVLEQAQRVPDHYAALLREK